MQSKLTIKLATLDPTTNRRRDIVATLDLPRLSVMIRRAELSVHLHSESGPVAIDVAGPADAAGPIDLDASDAPAATTIRKLIAA